MILGTNLVPVSQLSGAFLQPKTPMHLQFAYYESSLVVEYLIEKYGIGVLRRLLEERADRDPERKIRERDHQHPDRPGFGIHRAECRPEMPRTAPPLLRRSRGE